MNNANSKGAHAPPTQKLEDPASAPMPSAEGSVKSEVKVVKALNRVPRACNACRRQKMKCDGAEDPPCKRCRHAGLECLFEKPSREATLTGEAGLERIRSLEAHVADIRASQTSIQSSLAEILRHLRGGASVEIATPTGFHHHPSPSGRPVQSPTMSSPATITSFNHHTHSSVGPSTFPPQAHSHQGGDHQRHRGSVSSYQSPITQGYHPPQIPPSYEHYDPAQGYVAHTGAGPQTHFNQQGQYNQAGQVLPPFSSIQAPTAGTSHDNKRYRPHEGHRGKRPASSSASTSSDMEDEDQGELPASGLTAPWEVLKSLADVASERAQKESGGIASEPQSRARTPDHDRSRPSKRRKIRHKNRGVTFPDVVSKGIITQDEAIQLFKIFYHGCSTFLPVFDVITDTFEALHERSPFAVNSICMVAALVRDGGAAETFKKLLEETQAISCATLFAPVTRFEAVQAMILVAGWSEHNWLSGGHAVRMGLELGLHKAWPKLLKRMQSGKASKSKEDWELLAKSRTWLCLYLFEHQLSYGTGRPAVLKDDESIWQCRLLLQHPLAAEDDTRLVSTVELMAVRERINNELSPIDRPVDEKTFQVLRSAKNEFEAWFATWDEAFARKYENAAFYRQSLQIQHLHAELYHNATALRGIEGPEDVQRMPQAQRELAVRSIHVARMGLHITANSPAYREGLKYAVQYTHVTATFAASFLLRLGRLFPDDCNMSEIINEVERLADVMSEVPAKRYALTLRLMVKNTRKRRNESQSPGATRHGSHSMHMAVDASGNPLGGGRQEPFSPVYDQYSGTPGGHMQSHGQQMQQHQHQQHHHQHQQQQQAPVPHYAADAININSIWQGLESTAPEQMPVWISDQNLGGNQLSQNGMDAFLVPTDYFPPPPLIR